MSKLTEKLALNRSRALCLTNVKNLNCWGNDIEDISIVRQMVNLEVLNLSVNNVTTLKHLSYCPRLKEIYLRKNQVFDLNELKFLRNLPQLKVLWLADNPCATNKNYREIALRILPNLKKLDSEEITEQEKENALTLEDEVLNDGEEIEIPDFGGLDLNHTLTQEAVFAYTKQRKEQEEKPNLQEFEEKQLHHDVLTGGSSSVAPTQSVDIDDVNKRRAELGLKQLDISSSIAAASTQKFDNNYTVLEETQALKLSISQMKTESVPLVPRSNVANAVLLLLNEMSQNDLKEIIQAATDLLLDSDENINETGECAKNVVVE